LTMDGLKRRDQMVFETALGRSVPVAVVLAGGYARDTKDTVAIHCNTARAAREALVPQSKQH
jgi:acetoin utilization deacetylase AcuC-like enzyme